MKTDHMTFLSEVSRECGAIFISSDDDPKGMTTVFQFDGNLSKKAP